MSRWRPPRSSTQVVEDNKQVSTEDLIFSPKRFAIDPKGERTVRLLLKKPPSDKERVYRVVFRPSDRGFGTTLEGESQGRKTVLKVLTGMGILVYVDPRAPKEDFSWEREGGKVVFQNDGNIHVRLFKLRHCPTANEKDEEGCVQIPPRRVYGGKTHEIDVPPDRFVLFVKRVGASGEWESQIIPPA
jgi:P pilus assembly chaperone PapD